MAKINTSLYSKHATKRRNILLRLSELSRLLNKYANAVDSHGNRSQRQYDWMDEYNDIKENDNNAWIEYCDLNNLCETHEAIDCMA